MVDFARGLLGSDESSVGAVLASDVDSTEFKVEAMLCLEAERRIPELFDMLVWLVFGFSDLELYELEPAHSLPKNREADACICGKEIPVGTPCDWL